MSEKLLTTLTGESTNDIPETREHSSQAQDMTQQIASLRGRSIEQQRAALAEFVTDKKITELSDGEVQSLIADAAIDIGLKDSQNTAPTTHAAGKEGGVSFSELAAKLNDGKTPVLPHRPVRTLENGAMTNIEVPSSEVSTSEENKHISVGSEKPTRPGIGARLMTFMANRQAKAQERFEKRGEKLKKQDGESNAEYEKRVKREKLITGVAVAFGVTAGALLYLGSKGGHGVEGLVDFRADSGNDTVVDGVNVNLLSDTQEMVMTGPDPANAPGKLDPYNFGTPLYTGANEQLDAGKFAGYNELLTNRFPNNGNEFASFLANSNIDGAPDPRDADAINKFGEMLEDEHGKYGEYLDKIHEKFEGATFSEHYIENVTYTSYEIDPKTGKVNLNEHVTGSTKVITVKFEDGTVMEICENCGQIKMPGEQPIVEAPAPAPLGGALGFAELNTVRGNGGELTPVTPEQPVTPNVPDQPVTPEVPGTPGTPETPETPEGPEFPELPEFPEFPELPEFPNDGKIWDGHVEMPDGLDPTKNTFIGWTPGPDAGNGTDSPNLLGSILPGGEDTSYLDEDAQPNTAPQVTTPEEGVGTSRTPEDTVTQQNNQQLDTVQDTANNQADQMDQQMDTSTSVDQAVKDIQTQIGSDGRPK